MNTPQLSIVIPVYNEEGVLPHLYERLTRVMNSLELTYEVIWVNDRSTDQTLNLIKKITREDLHHFYISLSRNFGHQKAITAGLDRCKGQAAIIMDGDLQDPPELIPDLWKKHKEGYNVVYAQRTKRKGESLFKIWTASLFYRILKNTAGIQIPVDTGDFRLIDKRIIDNLKRMPEQHKFLRGQIAWIGFRQACVPYTREERFAGKTNFSTIKMIRFAFDGLTAFSNYPLKMATLAGFIVSGISFLIILYALISKFIMNEVITGWTSLIISSMFIGGVQLVAIGIIGEYISRISSDVRKRPLYIVDEENIQNQNAVENLNA